MESVKELLVQLNPRQREAVTYFDGPLLISAGAGSGKTRVITFKIAYMIREMGLQPEEVLALTFTNKAAHEMKERVQALTGVEGSRLWISTFHSFGLRLLMTHHSNGKSLSVLDREDQKALLKEIAASMKLKLDSDELKKVVAEISGTKRKGILIQVRAMLINYMDSRYIDLYLRYQKELEKRQAVDFEDLIARPTQMLKKDEELRKRVAAQFGYVLVDEFQDTSPEQYKLLRQITREKDLCVVGDEDQSIYSWRGADREIFKLFRDDNEGCKVIALEENYRSSKMIIQGASAVINGNSERIEKNLFTRDPEGDPILLYKAADKEKEAEFIASTIRNNTGARDFFPVGVLYRINSRSRALEDALNEAGVKYKIVGSLRFYERKEVKDLAAYLKLAYFPDDDPSFLRAISFPPRGIGEKTLEKVKEMALSWGIPYLEADRKAEREGVVKAGLFREFLSILDETARDLDKKPLDQVLKRVVERTDFRRFLTRKEEDVLEGRWENVEELLEIASRFPGEWTEFLSQLTLREGTEELRDEASVVLMTIHAAKGLEFNTVILAGVEEGSLPHMFAKESLEGLEEERRLFYVAMTRAKRRLFLTSCREWSRFVDEIPLPYRRFLR